MTACAARSGPRFPATDQPPPAVDPRLCAKVDRPAPPPKGSGIVAPATAGETNATAAFLTWAAETVDVALKNADRAELARRTVCGK